MFLLAFLYLLWKILYWICLPIFKIRLLLLLCIELYEYLDVLDISPYLIYDFQIFSSIPHIAFSFHWWFPLLYRFFAHQFVFLFTLMWFHSLTFPAFTFVAKSKKKIIAKVFIKVLTIYVFFHEVRMFGITYFEQWPRHIIRWYVAT